MLRFNEHSAYKSVTGFTLIEVLIVVAILGILAAIVVPSYSEQVRKSRRADAKISLMQIAQDLERCFSDNNSYVAGDPGCTDHNGTTSTDDYYDITAVQNADNYTLTANPKDAQADDTRCASFTLTQTGAKTATNSGGDAVDDCW